MKLFKISNKFISLLLCLVLAMDMYVAFETKLNFVRRNRFHRRRSVTAASTEPILKINNRIGNLAVGVLQGLANNETGWKNCLPAAWKNPEPVKEDTNTETFKQTGNLATKVWGIVKKILSVACPATQIMTNLKKITESLFGGQRRRVFLEGRFHRRRGIGSKIKDKLSKLKQHFKDAWNGLTKNIQDVFTEVEDHLVDFKNKLVAIYKGEAFQKFLTILQCLKGAGNAAYQIYSVINGFMTKITAISAVAAGTMGVGAAPLIAKFVWGLICKYDEFERAIGYFREFLSATDPNKKFFLLGLFLGQIIHAVGTARRRRLK